MCDTFVSFSTIDGKPIFGKNSDRPYDEVQNIVRFPRTKQENSTLKCTYIEIPQVEETYEVLLCQPFWMWGAEMGVNEHGVVIGNEAVWTEEPVRIKGLLGMDLLRLGLERGKTAREAMDKIIKLLEKYGQGGNCSHEGSMTYHNSFLIVDSREAWVLETADMWWVAEKVIKGIRNISNELSIRRKYDLIKEGTIEHAIKKGYCRDDRDFNFANCFSSGGVGETVSPFSRAGRCQVLLRNSQNNFSVEKGMTILRDHEGGICMHGGFRSTASQVTKIYEDGSTINWMTGTPEPCTSIFKPVFLPNADLPENVLESNLVPEKDKLWWGHTYFVSKADRQDINEFKEIEDILIKMVQKMESLGLAREKLNDFTRSAFQQELDLYQKVLE